MYISGAQTTVPPVLPNTGSGEITAVLTVIALAVGAAVVFTTVARQLAKKHYNA